MVEFWYYIILVLYYSSTATVMGMCDTGDIGLLLHYYYAGDFTRISMLKKIRGLYG